MMWCVCYRDLASAGARLSHNRTTGESLRHLILRCYVAVCALRAIPRPLDVGSAVEWNAHMVKNERPQPRTFLVQLDEQERFANERLTRSAAPYIRPFRAVFLVRETVRISTVLTDS